MTSLDGVEGGVGPVAIVGPTGSGKSRVALAVAEALAGQVEIVAVDAFTVYRGMDIGTAKPNQAEREQVRHHMIDLLDVEQDCTARWFQPLARERIQEVLARGRTPLLVGGSGLYFRTVVDDLEFPPTDPQIREALNARWSPDPAAAHAHLVSLDPDAAAKIDSLNLRRTVRALEVIQITDRLFSSYARAWQAYDSVFDDLTVIGIDLDRPTLRASLEERSARMLQAGWLDEVAALQGREMSKTAAQAIGYAELAEHLDGGLDLDEAVERITIRTRRFATRQQRWFASDPRVRWCAPDRAVDAVLAAMGHGVTRPDDD